MSTFSCQVCCGLGSHKAFVSLNAMQGWERFFLKETLRVSNLESWLCSKLGQAARAPGAGILAAGTPPTPASSDTLNNPFTSLGWALEDF